MKNQSDSFDLHSMPDWIEVEHTVPARGVWTHADLPSNTLLYRYMPLQWAIDVFGAKTFSMRQPRLWDDPYERWWSDQLFKAGSKLADARAFGSCWTTRYIDEQIWRIYMCPQQPEVPAIRISTRAGKLCARMKELCRTETGMAFLGRVRYTPKDRLTALAVELTGDPDNH